MMIGNVVNRADINRAGVRDGGGDDRVEGRQGTLVYAILHLEQYILYLYVYYGIIARYIVTV